MAKGLGGRQLDIVAIDIGGTHARFAIATLQGVAVVGLRAAWTARSADFPSLEEAWKAFAERLGAPPPRSAAIAIACPVGGPILRLTNSPWTIVPASLPDTLGVDRMTLINDFAAVGFALAQLGDGDLKFLCGPDRALPQEGVISLVGPGTGLGVAQLVRRGGASFVLATEGGHIDFAPLDPMEDALLQDLRPRYGRVSVERIVSGPGLAHIYDVLAKAEGRPAWSGDDPALWTLALAGEDRLGAAALERFCRVLGAAAGDLALAHGASAIVIAGGVGLRLANTLPASGFAQRLTAKGRFAAMMREIPVKLITYPSPGLLGAAAAFALQA